MSNMDILTVVLATSGLTVSALLVSTWILLRSLKERISTMFDELAVEKVTLLLQTLHTEPEKFKTIVNGAIGDLSKVVELPEFKMNGQAVSGNAIEAIIPMLPARWRGIAYLVSQFMGKGTTAQSEQKSRPFG